MAGNLVLIFALWIAGAAISQEAFPLGSSPAIPGILLVFIVSAAAVLGGGLPAKVLDASWRRALVSAFLGHLAGAALVFGLPWPFFDSWATYLGIGLILAAVVASLFWASASQQSGIVQVSGILLLAFCAALGDVFGGAVSLSLGFLAWALLPAISGLLGTGRPEPG